MQNQEKPSPITGNEGGPIDLKTAAEWTRYYRQRNPNETISHFFGNEILKTILGQPDCMGLRIYYANSEKLGIFQRILLDISNFLRKGIANSEGVKHIIIVGVNKDGTDQLPGAPLMPPRDKIMQQEAEPQLTVTAFKSSSGSTVGEQSMPCPGGSGCPQNELTH